MNDERERQRGKERNITTTTTTKKRGKKRTKAQNYTAIKIEIAPNLVHSNDAKFTKVAVSLVFFLRSTRSLASFDSFDCCWHSHKYYIFFVRFLAFCFSFFYRFDIEWLISKSSHNQNVTIDTKIALIHGDGTIIVRAVKNNRSSQSIVCWRARMADGNTAHKTSENEITPKTVEKKKKRIKTA